MTLYTRENADETVTVTLKPRGGFKPAQSLPELVPLVSLSGQDLGCIDNELVDEILEWDEEADPDEIRAAIHESITLTINHLEKNR